MTITDPVGVTEIAARAKVRAATVIKWRQRYADFPAPAMNLAMGPLWEWQIIEAWLAGHKRTPPANRGG